MEYKITKEQILDLAKTASLTESKLKRIFPDVFKPQFQIGEWYFYDNDKTNPLVNYQGGRKGYGFNSLGTWGESNAWAFITQPHKWKKAEMIEIFDTLSNEFKTRYNGKNFICLKTNNVVKSLIYNTMDYSMLHDSLVVDGHLVYIKGVWCETYTETLESVELSIDEIASRFGLNASQIKIKK